MNKRNLMNYAFIFIEVILYLLIILNNSLFKYFAYCSIIIAFLYSLTYIKKNMSKRTLLIQIGLFTTLIADFFLVLLSKYKEIAMVSFSFTQLSYASSLLLDSNNKKRDLIIRGSGSIIFLIITIIVLKEKTDFLSLISIFYFFNLGLNMILSFVKSPSLLFKIGLCLFICCDILIGIEGLTSMYLDSQVFDFLNNINVNLPWLFYLPSQVLISLSLYEIERRGEDNARLF